MGDTGNALLAAIAITSALYHRDRTGVGQAVGTSIVNAGLLHTSYAWIHADGSLGDWAHVDGGQFGLSPYYRMYECADGRWLFLAAVSGEERSRLSRLVGGREEEMVEAAAAEFLASQFRGRPAAEWFAALDEAAVPVEIVNEEFCQTIFDDPEARRLHLVSETWCGGGGRFEDPGLLVNLSPARGVIQRGPCMCGEHSREILLEHGFSEGEIDVMTQEGAVLDAPLEVSHADGGA